MKFAFLIDPIDGLDPGHDTSVALMEAAQNLGHKVYITKFSWLSVLSGKAWAFLQPVQLIPVKLLEGHWVAQSPWYQLGNPVLQCLEEIDAVFVRTDPPFNAPYLHATYILDYVNPAKTLVINSPMGLRNVNDKTCILQFSQITPETIISSDIRIIRKFLEKKREIVLKPLVGKRGEGVLLLKIGDLNLASLLEISTQKGQVPVIVQAFLPAVECGDKRIVLLNGEPIGAFNRISSGEDFRCNIPVGGRFAKVDITERDRQICSQIKPMLQQNGLYFVGIDVIGGYLTEVNVTTPAGICQIDLLEGVKLAEQVVAWVVSACYLSSSRVLQT